MILTPNTTYGIMIIIPRETTHCTLAIDSTAADDLAILARSSAAILLTLITPQSGKEEFES